MKSSRIKSRESRRSATTRRRSGRFGVFHHAGLVRVVGEVTHAHVEPARLPENVDHFWITVDTGAGGRVELSVNTLSIKNRDAGFDPRVRVGRIQGEWEALPAAGAELLEGFDYGEVETEQNVFYEHFERSALEELLQKLCDDCWQIEAWGAPYFRKGPGLHQLHSRRASCAVPGDLRGQDGGLKFYFGPEKLTTTLFLKFCGQA